MTAFHAILDAAERFGDAPLPPLPKSVPAGAQARPEHKDAARQIAWALAKGTGGDWLACGAALRLLLDAREAFGLAMAALGAMEEKHLPTLLEEALPEYAGPPMPPFVDVTDQAAWWAGIASDRELRAYALAALARLPEEDRREMVAALSGRRTA